MVEEQKSGVERLLQAAVQSVQWSYIIFWKLCPQRGNLVWSDGYYNGAIKTRKTTTTHSHEETATAEDRSQQLRELYQTLAGGTESSHRPSTSLSPEDLTESEWFYLMCVSFSFPPGMGLPGKAYADRQHIWLARANEADSNFFSRNILAKSAKIQTVICIPDLLDGVVELGTTGKVEEDIGVIENVKSFFPNPPPRPALSEQHSTSDPPTSFYSPTTTTVVEEDEEEEEEEDEVGSDSEPPTRPPDSPEPMQVDMSHEDIKVGSPDDSSSNHFEYSKQDDSHFSQIVSCILENHSNRPSMLPSSAATSAFCKWTSSTHHRRNRDGPSQWAIKHILLAVPLLHDEARGDIDVAAATLPLPQDDLSDNHVIAERRRREKLNEHFIVLRSMVPFITKMDKASILADTIDYMKQLKNRIQELESTVRQTEVDKNGGMVKKKKKKTKKKMRMVEESAVEVSIIESDALVEIECLQKEGLLLDAMQVLAGLGLQVTTVQSSIDSGIFTAEFRAKVNVKANGRKTSIMEVKRKIKEIIQHN